MCPPLRVLRGLTVAALTTVVPVRGQLIASNLDQPNDGGAGVAGPGAIGGWAFRSNNDSGCIDDKAGMGKLEGDFYLPVHPPTRMDSGGSGTQQTYPFQAISYAMRATGWAGKRNGTVKLARG